MVKRFIFSLALAVVLSVALFLIMSAHPQDDTGYVTEQSAMYGVLVDIGADAVYIGNFFIGTPTITSDEPVSEVQVVYLGNFVDDVLDKFALCLKQVETVIACIEGNDGTDDSRIVVFSFVSEMGLTMGYSISHNPVRNAILTDCYTVHLIECIRLNY